MNISDLRVLVVDDHPAQRKLVTQMLRHLGVKDLSEADSGEAALQCLMRSAAPFDAVLADLDMPSGDGFDLAQGVRRASAGTAVTLMTAIHPRILAGINALLDEGSQLVRGVLRKPLGLEALRAWLHDLCAVTSSNQTLADSPFGRNALVEAIEQAQIRPWFEPQIDLANGCLLGFEALARWHHPLLGALPPARFIPTLESTPLLSAMTLSMMEQGLAAMRQWPCTPQVLRLSFNIGMACLEDGDFALKATRCVSDAGIDTERLTLEVTESASMNDAEAVVTTLARLRMRGFELAVDDFGTGYASLRQFSYGAYSEVKIDRQFVARILSDRTAHAAVESIAALARGLDMRCVAEGIEDPAVLAEVQRIGCNTGQGWLWSRPLAPESVSAWIAARVGSGLVRDKVPSPSTRFAREQKL